MTAIRKFKVGGDVRDRIMGRVSHDVDFAVTGFETFEQMVEWVRTQGEVFVVTPSTFTARARVGKDVFDYVWARIDGPYSDGRHPDWVAPARTIEDDLARRDFTINAIAETEDGSIIDPFDGRGDIERGIIRAVGDATQRFTEDALRIIRGIRFAVVFGFDIDSATEEAMQAQAWRIPEFISQERIREEMTRVFAADTIAAFRTIERIGITEMVFSGGMWAKPTTEKAKG